MSVSSVGASNSQVYGVSKSHPKPQSTAPTKPKDADGDHDGTTAAKAAAYQNGSAVDVTG